jgi:methyltransferase (TIGR00027 family)
MSFPDMSYARTVGEWRYIQSIHEPVERKNPDRLVGELLPLRERYAARWVSRKRINALRSHLFYYYLVARTKYYDEVFLEAMQRGVRHIINIGSGTDTRAYRFADQVKDRGIDICECDQPTVIRAKHRICERRWPSSPVCYLPIDLNDATWPEFERWLDKTVAGPALVMMEGLTPYLDDRSVGEFLAMLARRLPAGGSVAYDFKISGVADAFGARAGSGPLFRLPSAREDVARYHEELGYRLTHMERSDELSMRMIPDLATAGIALFREDVVIQAELVHPQ